MKLVSNLSFALTALLLVTSLLTGCGKGNQPGTPEAYEDSSGNCSKKFIEEYNSLQAKITQIDIKIQMAVTNMQVAGNFGNRDNQISEIKKIKKSAEQAKTDTHVFGKKYENVICRAERPNGSVEAIHVNEETKAKLENSDKIIKAADKAIVQLESLN